MSALNCIRCFKMKVLGPNFFNSLSQFQSASPVLLCLAPSESKRHFSGNKSQKSRTYYYDVLGLTPKATQSQIKTAYYKLSKQYHPDVSSDKKNHLLFAEISEAYEILGQLKSRRLYDKGIFAQRSHRAEAEDMADDYTRAYRQEGNFGQERKPPPRGRTTIYDFDEFYRRHYNDVRERRYEEWQNYKKEQASPGETEPSIPVNIAIIIAFMLAATILITETSFSSSYPPRPRRN